MRLGCAGCLATLVSLGAVWALVGGGAWAWSRAWLPPSHLVASHAGQDASAADQKLAGLGPKAGGRASRPDAIVLSEAEVSAVVSRFLEDAGLLRTPLLTTEMRGGRALVQWRGPAVALLQGPPLGWLSGLVTQRMGQTPLWITLAGDVQVGSASRLGRPRYAEVRLASARVGRLPVPGWLLMLMVGPRGASLLRWPVPATVDWLEVGERQLTIGTR